jgi:hypothetical protein
MMPGELTQPGAADNTAIPHLRPAQQLEADLRRLNRIKRHAVPEASPLGSHFVAFFRQNVQKRHEKLGKVSQRLQLIVPAPLLEHCCIDSLTRGTLTLLCDSSPHLYDLKLLMLAGMEQQILTACRPCGVTKVSLKLGRWYEGSGPAQGDVRFEPIR